VERSIEAEFRKKHVVSVSIRRMQSRSMKDFAAYEAEDRDAAQAGHYHRVPEPAVRNCRIYVPGGVGVILWLAGLIYGFPSWIGDHRRGIAIEYLDATIEELRSNCVVVGRPLEVRARG
jgi:hypothetical protein